MTESAPPRSLSEWFAHLQDLEAGARDAELKTLAAPLAARLRALLDADALPDHALSAALAVSAQADLLEPPARDRIGPWRVLGELGRGGMGSVWLGERELDGTLQRGAIKLMRGRAGQEDRTRFRRERQILATLDHPDIARLIDGGETDDGQPYLVVEFVRGETLAARLKEHRPDRHTAVAWAIRIAAAVQHAHQHLVIHRDLKPANVMITPEGGIKLLDFGVAKLLEPGTDVEDASTRVFTEGYASPEQLAGRAVGTTSDVYSLGRILIELLGPERLPQDLRTIVQKATEELSTERYPSMSALHDDLFAWQRGLPVQARSASIWYRSQKLIRRHPMVSIGAAFLIGVILLFGWRWYEAGVRATEQRDRAEAARALAERQLRRSQQVVRFYAEMFAGVAPEHAAGQKLAPAELLQRAERLLRDAAPEDPVLRADLSATLGTLYQRLGDGEHAVPLLQAGLAEAGEHDAMSELQRADREHALALILADLDRREEALTYATSAQARRQRAAPEDARQQFGSELLLANLYQGMHQLDAAQAAMTRAETWFAQLSPDSLDQLNLLQAQASLHLDRQQFAAALSAAEQAIRRLQTEPSLDQTRAVELQRSLARARQALGDLHGAEQAFAAAIAAQTQFIGDHGTRAMGLHNDHAILLASLGRFAEAKAEYEHAARLFAQTGGPAPEQNPRHLNNLCDTETGTGDYAQAIRHCQAALQLQIAEGRSDQDPDRLLLESNLARAQGYAGQTSAALRGLQSVRARALASQGEASFIAWLQAFRGVRIAILGSDQNLADEFARQTEQGLTSLFPTPHPWRARSLRTLVRWQWARGDLTQAQHYLDLGEQEAGAVFPDDHPVRAQLALDRALLAQARDDLSGARSSLTTALAILRQCCAPTEVDRAEAESLNARLPP